MVDGMFADAQQHMPQQPFGQPDPASYRLKQRRKAIRKPSLERQGGFEQCDENYAAEQRRKSIMEQQQQNQQQHQNQQQQQHQQFQQVQQQQNNTTIMANIQQPPSEMNNGGGVNRQQQAPYMQNNIVNNAFNSGFQPPFTGRLNAANKDDQMQQDRFGNFTNNNAVPELELNSREGFYQQQNLNGGQKKDGELPPKVDGSFPQPSSQQKQQQPSNATKQLNARLQSQDTMSSDMANCNFDGDWANSEDYLDQQFEENWSRRQAQFENDMSKGPLSATNADSGPFNAMHNSANNNFTNSGEQQWNNNAGQQQQQQMNGVQKDDPMNNFFEMENEKGAKVEFTPPSIVISNTDFNERERSQSRTRSDQADVTMEEEKKQLDGNGNFGMVITEMNGNNSTATGTTKHIFGDTSETADFGVQPKPFGERNDNQTQMLPEMTSGSTEQQDNSIKPNVAEPGVKSVKFNEEVEKKSPPHMLLSSLFGGSEPLVVQTNTEGMSRARVRWINAFNKISSHLTEVRFIAFPCTFAKFIFQNQIVDCRH